jgi:predicted transcriptional regulator
MSRFKRLFEEMACEKAPGPSPTFSLFHLLNALELIGEKPVGRSKLAKELEVGEGTVRTLIERLRDFELITTSKAGCALTQKGLRLWKEYKSIFPKKTEIEKSEIAFAEHNFAVLVKNNGSKIKSGVEQRDAAVVVGAKGATSCVFKEGRLIIPAVSNDVAKDFPEAAEQIFRLLQPAENDVVVVGSAESSVKAMYGALAAAWTLLDDC